MSDYLTLNTNAPDEVPPRGIITIYFNRITGRIEATDWEENPVEFNGDMTAEVIDNLNSSSTTLALSANQGRILDTSKAPKASPSFTGQMTITGTANGGLPNVTLDGSILPGTNFRGAAFANSGELASNSIVRTMVDTRVPLAVSRDSIPTGGVADYKTVWVYPSRNTLNLDALLFGVYSYDGEVNGKPSFRKDAFTSIYWDGIDSWLVEGLTRTWKKTGADLHVGGSWVLDVGTAVVGGNIQLYFDTLKAGQFVFPDDENNLACVVDPSGVVRKTPLGLGSSDNYGTVVGQEYLTPWFNKVQDFAADPDAALLRISCCGDSTTFNYNFVPFVRSRLLATGLRDVTVSNDGANGIDTSTFRTTLLPAVLAAGYDMLIVRFGINDLNGLELTPAEAAAEMELFLQDVRAEGDFTQISVVLMSPNAFFGINTTVAEQQEFAYLLRKLAREYKCAFIDTYSIFTDYTGFGNDGVHPQEDFWPMVTKVIGDTILPASYLDTQTVEDLNTTPPTPLVHWELGSYDSTIRSLGSSSLDLTLTGTTITQTATGRQRVFDGATDTAVAASKTIFNRINQKLPFTLEIEGDGVGAAGTAYIFATAGGGSGVRISSDGAFGGRTHIIINESSGGTLQTVTLPAPIRKVVVKSDGTTIKMVTTNSAGNTGEISFAAPTAAGGDSQLVPEIGAISGVGGGNSQTIHRLKFYDYSI